MRRAALAVIVASLAITSSAGAKPTNPTQLAQRIATHYWGHAPCHVRTSLAPVPRDVYAGYVQMENAMAAASNQPPPLWTLVLSYATRADCTVHFNGPYWGTRSNIDAHFADFCTSMIHEYGVLLGRPENDDPASIMDRTGALDPDVCWNARVVTPGGRVLTGDPISR